MIQVSSLKEIKNVGEGKPSVGASLLAKNLNDNACLLNERGAYEFFASKLAPTK